MKVFVTSHKLLVFHPCLILTVHFYTPTIPSLRFSNTLIFLTGYDDEHGSYKRVSKDHLVYRYEVLDILGKGSFGQVLKVLDHKTGQYLAIKVIRNKKR